MGMDFQREVRKRNFMIPKEISWKSEDANDYEVNQNEIELIIFHESNNPEKGCNRLPKYIPKQMTEIQELTKALIEFRDARDWGQFHNSKDLAIAISIESNELLELFLWKDSKEANKQRIKEELSDVFAYALLLADKQGFNVKEILLEKIKANSEKYPIEKSRGSAKKYSEL
jgi:NTP pyrophosphatase (non-canonical NTP hydrolase)